MAGYQRNPRSRTDTKVNVQFVNVRAPGQESKEERTGTGSIVRANAAHFHWRHNRPPRSEEKPRVPRTIQKRARKDSDKLKKRLGTGVQSSRFAEREKGQLQNANSHISQHDFFNNHDEFMSVTTLPWRDSQLNPPACFASELPSYFVTRCITYNAQIILPAMFTCNTDSLDIRTNMLQLSISHTPILHLFVMGALIFTRGALAIVPGDPQSFEMFRARAEIVKHVSRVIADSAEACSDVNIFAVASLATKGPFQLAKIPTKVPRQGPLRGLQSLNSFGVTESVPIHVDGLSKMIRLKGGLDKIEMPGLAAMISFNELCLATRDLTAPRYPLVTLSGLSKTSSFQLEADSFDPDKDVSQVISMLKGYTTIIENHCEGRQVLSPFRLIDYRNATQHALLSLAPRAGSSECVRLAMLIYSLLVTFPLSFNASPTQQLVTQLHTALTMWDGCDQVLMWVLAMGGIGATGSGERVWFVKMFRGLAIRMGITYWNEARSILQQNLWFDATNDEDGSDLWRDSQSIEEHVE